MFISTSFTKGNMYFGLQVFLALSFECTVVGKYKRKQEKKRKLPFDQENYQERNIFRLKSKLLSTTCNRFCHLSIRQNEYLYIKNEAK